MVQKKEKNIVWSKRCLGLMADDRWPVALFIEVAE